jgi:hypothetical protein
LFIAPTTTAAHASGAIRQSTETVANPLLRFLRALRGEKFEY